ncbi:hypothetical protein SEA_NOSHOW_42 [Mycobacterium phage NoShow]|nr:hypothetical protein SEA_NOSHOW_42 [Mycobacterium phage NoShow]
MTEDLFDVLHAIVALLDDDETDKAFALADEWASKDTRRQTNVGRFL